MTGFKAAFYWFEFVVLCFSFDVQVEGSKDRWTELDEEAYAADENFDVEKNANGRQRWMWENEFDRA